MIQISEILLKDPSLGTGEEVVGHHRLEATFFGISDLEATLEPLPATRSPGEINRGPMQLQQFPLQIGRQSRDSVTRGITRGISSSSYLVVDKSPHNVSREHCSITRVQGRLEVVDLGSTLGTVVNGHRIGKMSDSMTGFLYVGENEIVLGCRNQGPRFRIIVTRKPG